MYSVKSESLQVVVDFIHKRIFPFGKRWGAHASVLRTSALGLVYSATEYAAPAWCRSTHTKKLDVSLNDTLRIISVCLKPPAGSFYQYSRAFHRPTCAGNIPLSSWRSRHN